MMRRIAIILTGLFFVTALTASRLSVRRTIVEGNEAFRQGNAAAAESRYADAVRQQPDSGPARFNLGTVAYERRQYTKASEYFAQSATNLSALNEQAQAHYNRGNALFQLGSLPESRDAFKDALRRDPSDEDARYNFVFVDRLLRGLELSGGAGRTDPTPLTRDQAEHLLNSLGQTALKMRHVGGSARSPTPDGPNILDK